MTQENLSSAENLWAGEGLEKPSDIGWIPSTRREISRFALAILSGVLFVGAAQAGSDQYITKEQQAQIIADCDKIIVDWKLTGREVVCGGKKKNEYLGALEGEISESIATHDRNIATHDRNIATHDRNIATHDRNIATHEGNIARNKEDIEKLKIIDKALARR